MSFPAPQRFDDGFAIWAGYKEPVALPVAFTLADPKQPATIEAKVFLGICETICVPVQATFTVEPGRDPDNADDAATVKAALDALPGPEQPDFGVTVVKGGKDEVLVEAAFAGEPEAVDFFMAGDDGYQFGPPERRIDGERLLFAVPILERPEQPPAQGAFTTRWSPAPARCRGRWPIPRSSIQDYRFSAGQMSAAAVNR